MQQHIQFSNAATDFYFDTSLETLQKLAPTINSFIITDENLMMHYQKALKPWRVITIPAGESAKNLEVLDDIIRQLIALDAGRDALIIGLGGGVVTDMAGFVAGIYKRGVRCGFVPTSILAMVDAAIGGKNGLDIGEYKNMIGLIRQPEFLLYDYNLLQSLPDEEWINGFAEIIKHSAIQDKNMFAALQQNTLDEYKNSKDLLSTLIQQNALLKARIVQEDEFETGERKLLNFGHTLGHAIENVYELPHGHAIAIGMVFAARLSEQVTGFTQSRELISLLEQYGLPIRFSFDKILALKNMTADKKKTGDEISYILLQETGKAIIHPLSIDEIKQVL